MKKKLQWLVYLVVAAQVIWLICNYHARRFELENSPRIRVAAAIYDPRDLTRGYYQSLNCVTTLRLDEASSLFGTSIDQRALKESMLEIVRDNETQDYTVVPDKDYTPEFRHSSTATPICKGTYEFFTIIAFWKKQENGLWKISRLEHENHPEDSPRAGEIRIPMEAHWQKTYERSDESKTYTVSAQLRINFHGLNLRYYYEESAEDFFSLLREEIIEEQHVSADTEKTQAPRRVDITVELSIRPRNNVTPVEMYLNDIPYHEATDLLKRGKFPFRPNTESEQTESRTNGAQPVIAPIMH